jgi:YggT family protein
MASVLCLIVRLYLGVLFARAIISFVFLFRPDWRPPPGIRPLLDLMYAVTDPPVNFLRRFIPPLRSGAMALDLAFIVWVIIVAYVIRGIFCFGGF